MNTRVVVTNGNVLDVNVRSLIPDVTLQFPQELGVPVTVRPADRAQKVHKQDAILIPTDSGHNFHRRLSCPELPNS